MPSLHGGENIEIYGGSGTGKTEVCFHYQVAKITTEVWIHETIGTHVDPKKFGF